MAETEDGGVSPLRRLAAVAKPTGKTYRKRSGDDLGDGDLCPVDGHGRMYTFASGRQWCPHQSHDKPKETTA